MPEMDSASFVEEKSNVVTHTEIKRAEDMDSGAGASCSVVQIEEDGRGPETNEFKWGQSGCIENEPDERVQESMVAQNEGIIKAEKCASKQSKQEKVPWIKENTGPTEVPERPLTQEVNEALKPSLFIKTKEELNPTTSEEPLEKIELPGTCKCYQDAEKPSTVVEMSSTRRGEVSSRSEEESETELELESGVVQNCLFTIPVEEKGIASFLDSCQEALALDFEVIRLNEADQARAEHQEETKHNRMRLRDMGKQECSVS